MYRLFGWILAGGIVLAGAGAADAQIAVSVGNPYTGTGFSLGMPGGYGYYGVSSFGYPYGGAPLLGTTYSSGYAGYVAPATGYFRTGYYGAYPATAVVPYAYPRIGYGGMYGYSPYGYGYGLGRRGMWGGGRFWGRW